MSYQNVKNYRTRLKERSVYVMGGKCAICGYEKCQSALEFHHLNPEEKDFTFSKNANRSWDTIREELKKCIMVCANCHREIHAGLIPDDILEISYDENKAAEINDLVDQVKHKTIWYCKMCGTEIYKGSSYCIKCAAIRSRSVERPNRQELKNLIRNNSFVKIGEQYNISDNAIRKWCKSENLPYRKADIKNYTDEEWELI